MRHLSVEPFISTTRPTIGWLSLVLSVTMTACTCSSESPSGPAASAAVNPFVSSAASTASTAAKVNSLVPRPNPSALKPGDKLLVEARKEARASLSFLVDEMSQADKFRNRHFTLLSYWRPDGADALMFDLWLTVVSHKEGSFTCRVDKPRAELPAMKVGTIVEMKAADVYDWRITDDSGKIFGSYVLRATLGQLSPDARAAVESVLQPLPTQ